MILRKFSILFIIFCCTLTHSQKIQTYLTNYKINKICPTENAVWATTDSGIIAMNYNGTIIGHYTVNDGLPTDTINSLAYNSFDKSMWFATKKGLVRYKNGAFKKYLTEDGLQSDTINDLLYHSNNKLYIATQRGLSIIDTSLTITNDPFFTRQVYKLREGGNGQIWTTSWGELYFSTGTQWEISSYPDITNTVREFDVNKSNELSSDTFIKIIVNPHGGTVYIPNGVICQINNDAIHFETSSTPLPSRYITDVYSDNRNRWCYGTKDGLAIFDHTGWIVIQKKHGLPHKSITSIAEHQNILWVGTEKGVAKITEETSIASHLVQSKLITSIVQISDNMTLISTPSIHEPTTIQISNTLGKKVYQGVSTLTNSIYTHTIPTTQFSRGIYYFTIVSNKQILSRGKLPLH